jgi:hypothetical protein
VTSKRADIGQLITHIGMYGPPQNCKQELRMTFWSAPMYSALLESTTPGQDGIRPLSSLPS